MTIKLSATHVLVDDPDRALAFYRDLLGLTVVADVAKAPYRWITLAFPDQPGVTLVLSQPHAGRTQEDGDTLARLLAKGSLTGPMILAAKNLDETFAKLRASGADVVQEPQNQPWGVRDCSVRDPAGNMIRINQA